jgi:hypothetical protein
MNENRESSHENAHDEDDLENIFGNAMNSARAIRDALSFNDLASEGAATTDTLANVGDQVHTLAHNVLIDTAGVEASRTDFLETIEPKKYIGELGLNALDKIGSVAQFVSAPGIKKAVAPTMKALCSMYGVGSDVFSSGNLATGKSAYDSCASQVANVEAVVDGVQKGAAVVMKAAKAAGDFFKTTVAQKVVHKVKHAVSKTFTWFKDAFKPNKPASTNVDKGVTALLTKQSMDGFAALETVSAGGTLTSAVSATYTIAQADGSQSLIRISYVVGEDTKRVLSILCNETEVEHGNDFYYTRSYQLWDEVQKWDGSVWAYLGAYSGRRPLMYQTWNIHEIGELTCDFNQIWSIAHAASHCDDKPSDVSKIYTIFNDITSFIEDDVKPEWWDSGCSIAALKNTINQSFNHGSSFADVAISPMVSDSLISPASTPATYGTDAHALSISNLATYKSDLLTYLDDA